MKKRNREINVFSVSALDLFASALGAFILMSLIFMVFFAMTSPDSGQAEETLAALEACEAQLADSVDASDLAQCRATLASAEQERSSLAEELDKVKIPHLDVVVCLDITGSMADQIAGLKQEVSDLVRVLDGLAPSTGIGVVAYGDRQYDQVTQVQPIIPTTSMPTLQRFVNSLQPRIGRGSGGNEDFPEALDTALAQAIALNWRAESERRYIIVVTDAPAYPHKETAAIQRAGDFARSGNQFVSTVMVERYDAESFLRQLAGQGRGQFVNAVGGQSMLASVLLAVINV